MTLDGDVARLARTRPFDILPREAVQLIAFSCEKRKFQANDTLFLAGEEGEEGYFLLSGSVELVAGVAGPRVVRAGALIGESALYAPAIRRTTARAVEDSLTIRIPRSTFRRVLAEFPSAADKLRAALAARTRKLVEGLDARARSFQTTAEPRSDS